MEEGKAVRTVGGMDAGYLFEFTPEGVFLTVYPSTEGDLSFELSDMRQVLQEYSVVDYDIALLSRAVREASGRPVKLSGIFEEPENSESTFANVVVEVSKDRMQATVRFDTSAGMKSPTVGMVMEALKEKNISFGIDTGAIKEGVRTMTPFVAARGVPPVHGENARIERRFDLGVKGQPVIYEYDRVDYKNLNLFVLAKRNDVLAVRIPQTPGTPGTNVFGDEVAARHGRPTPMPMGKNTRVVGENDLVANIDGQIVDKKTTISVDPHLLLQGGVNVGTGNIDFTGSVEIKGNVEQGFVVKATGDVDISGTVNGATVEGRNVFIGGGINGMNKAKIKAGEDIRAAFVEMADVEAGSDIYITDVALHSHLRAGKKIILEGKKAQITGGTAEAGEEIRATCIGNSANVVTKVAVGIDPNVQKQYKAACLRYKESKKRLQQITQTLNTLSKIDVSRLPQERIDQINALTRSQFPLAGQIRKDENLIKQLEQQLAEMKRGKILVSDTIYAGTRLAINSVQRPVLSEIKRCSLTMDNDQIMIGPS
ncbi:MAG: DUF342 domain-containing protein [Selenomonadaceae bacterium]|nr:DUF342 domain-containing protein [Selenomonadaceae bacterium]